MTHRQVIEEAGFEALRRLDDIALRDAGPCRPVACFLPGLSNGLRFPFDLTDLHRLDDALFEDCMAVLRMDARVTAREVHTCLCDGSASSRRWPSAGVSRTWRRSASMPSVRRSPRACQHRLHEGGRFEANAQYTGFAAP